jgi:hypothetical protein
VKQQGFFFEIKDVVTQFVTAFNDVTINRYNKSRESQQKLKVSYVYAPKQRVMYDIINKNQHITLPVIAVNISGIARDETRVFNKILGSYYTTTIDQSTFLPQPVPINITIDMSIMTKYQTDMDQILSNFIPHTDPYIVISWKTPADLLPNTDEIRTEVMWSGNMSMKYPTDLQATTPARIVASTSFTLKSWLFKPVPADEPSNIFKVTTNFVPITGFEVDYE